MITCESCDKFEILQVTGYENGRVEITDLKNSNDILLDSIQSPTFFSHVGPVTSISFGSVDEIPYFISTGSDGKLILWNKLNGLWSQKILDKSKAPITCASFSCDSSLIAYADQNGKIKFINTKKSFDIDEKVLETKIKGIHQVCFVNYQNDQCLAIINPDGQLQINKVKIEKDDITIEQFITCQFSKSYVKGIAALNQYYIAGICFENIVRIFDLKMFSISEIKLEISPLETTNDDNIYYTIDNPIYALKWEEPLRKLFIFKQKQFQVNNISTINLSNDLYKVPVIEKEKYVYTKDPLGIWTKIE